MLRHRRPRTGALRAIYDEGAAAVASGAPNPYDPPQRAGDATRAHLWRQGNEDEREAGEIEALI